MRSHRIIRAAALTAALTAAGALAAGSAAAHGTQAPGTPLPKGAVAPKAASVTRVVALNPMSAAGVRGLAVLRQRGTRIAAAIVVWGLAPGTRHAAHVHGPRASCRSITTRHATEFPDLVANAQGVAYARVTLRTKEQVAGRRGYFVMFHAGPTMPSAMPSTPKWGLAPGDLPNKALACGSVPVR